MKTEILPVDEYSLDLANKIIRDGGLVSFSTETVYGLGANAFLDDAIKNIYIAKGRPLDNPLIVHVHKDYDITNLVYDNELAKKLRSKFLPGPLTMVYNAKNSVSGYVSCGLNTFALRVPSEANAQRFLRYVDLPIAAPSANISKHTSPVTAKHVFDDFNGKIPLILDGGRCEGGIESTVIDVTADTPVILRKGLITAKDIISVVGKCEYAKENSDLNVRSPGTKYRHYTPNTDTALFNRTQVDEAIKLYNSYINVGKKPYFLCDSHMIDFLSDKVYNVLDLGANGKEMASRLYYLLHEGEKLADILISFELELDDEIAFSVNNRFMKAFAKIDR